MVNPTSFNALSASKVASTVEMGEINGSADAETVSTPNEIAMIHETFSPPVSMSRTIDPSEKTTGGCSFYINSQFSASKPIPKPIGSTTADIPGGLRKQHICLIESNNGKLISVENERAEQF